jgi:3'-5' exoribonuclease
MKKQNVKDLLNAGTVVDSIFVADNVDIKEARSPGGNKFLLLQLHDATGGIKGVCFSPPPDILEALKDGDIIAVKGQTGDTKYGYQVNISFIRILPESGYEPEDFLERSPRPTEEMSAELTALISGITDPELKSFLSGWLLDPAFLKEFLRASAAKVVHHAYIGGLAEHSLETAKIALTLAGLRPEADRDIVIAGALLHDVGKMKDYRLGTRIEMTDDGRLMNHIALGFAMTRDRLSAKSLTDKNWAKHLSHILLSHHGELDPGSPVQPATMEAAIIHYADLASGRLDQFRRVLATTDPDDPSWTTWNKHLGRSLYKGFNTPK